MGKNTLMKRCIRLYIEKTGNDKWTPLLEQLVGNVGLIFTKVRKLPWSLHLNVLLPVGKQAICTSVQCGLPRVLHPLWSLAVGKQPRHCTSRLQSSSTSRCRIRHYDTKLLACDSWSCCVTECSVYLLLGHGTATLRLIVLLPRTRHFGTTLHDALGCAG